MRAISRAAALCSAFEGESAGSRGIGEGDALADGAGEYGWIVIGQRFGCFAGDDGAGAEAPRPSRGKLGSRWRRDQALGGTKIFEGACPPSLLKC
jgi:hypothetical protein